MELRLGGKGIAVCRCADAECFSLEVLRMLLLSEGESELICAMAMSENDGIIKVKTELLN